MPDRLLPVFLRFFLPIAVLVALGAYLMGASQVKSVLADVRSKESLNVGRGAAALSGAIVEVVRDVRFLSTQNELQRVLESTEPGNLQALAHEYMHFSNAKQLYDQIRWIDETGLERVRVDRLNGHAVNLTGDKLQNKGNRYFFTDTVKLAPGDIFISPLDLNVEGNAIEVPHKPMIRFATPVADTQGMRRGIVIANLYGRELLHAFAAATSDIASRAMLLNGEGYWLKSPAPEDEWGFMFKKRDLTLAHRAPEAWSQMRATDEGQMVGADGLWTWQSVYPLLEGTTSSTGSADAYQPSQGDVKSRQYVWKSVSHRSAAELRALTQRLWLQTGMVALTVIALFALVCLGLARTWMAKARAEADTRQANAALRVELDRSSELNKKLTHAQNQLLQADRLASIGQLAAGVAHEINTPTGFVHSNLHTLQAYATSLLGIANDLEAWLNAGAPHDDTLDALRTRVQAADLGFLRDDLLALLKESSDGLDRIKKIVGDLKGFARVDTADWADADLNACLDSALRLIEHEIKHRADIVRDLNPLPGVRCNAGKLNQVFLNLLLNAAHAIAERGTITLRSRHEGDWVSISISDTGCGIAPENLHRIFDPFYTTKPVGKGTGLGLSLAWGIVEDHHGRIEVTSSLGQGTTFTVRLPIQVASS